MYTVHTTPGLPTQFSQVQTPEDPLQPEEVVIAIVFIVATKFTILYNSAI
jgi:hypothetical protein